MHHDFSCIIIDDEQYAVELLADRICKLYKKCTVVGKYLFWEEALEALREQKCDLVFMDISLPGKNAIDILKLLPGLQCEIIFVTAFEQYALDAFSFAASGYILKPVGDAALSGAVNKALERIQNKRLARLAVAAASFVSEKLGIPNSHGIDYVNINEILYLETINKYTKIVTEKTEYISSYQLGKYKDQLGALPFFQVHRSYVINLNYILRFETTGFVVMTNKREIPVARTIKHEFLKIFNSDYQ